MPDGDIIHKQLGNMQYQTTTLHSLLNDQQDHRTKWASLTGEYPVLDDIVDHTADLEGLESKEMRQKLIRLFETYVTEWFDVEDQIIEFLSSKNIDSDEHINTRAMAFGNC